MKAGKTVPVQIRLRQESIDKIDAISSITGKNRTQVIIDGLSILKRLIDHVQDGKKILIMDPCISNKCVEIEFIGLNLPEPKQGE